MNPRVSVYSRLNSDYESLQVATAQTPIEHNLDTKKLQSRCCMCISAALLIAFVLWMFDPPAGHEATPDPDNTDTQLKFVVALHRHGARSSLNAYEFEKDIEWEVPPGKLLNVGFLQGFEFGQQLRSHYWSVSSYFDSSVVGFSTDIDRTVDTANSVLIGLFTDNTTEVGEANCTCRPTDSSRSTAKCVAKCIGVEPPRPLPTVVVWDEDSGNDMILRQYDVCEGMGKWRKSVMSSNEYKNASNGSFQSAFEYAKEIIGGSEVCSEDGNDCHELTVADLENMYSTVECLASQDGDHNGPYEDVDEAFLRLTDPATWYWHQMYSTENGPSVGGILLDRIITNLEGGTKRKPPSSLRGKLFTPNQGPLMILYSAHDSTMASLLAAMNITDWKIPQFTSHIVFELYGPTDPSTKPNPSNHYIRILYDEGPLLVGGCQQDFCLLKTFIDSLSDRRQSKDDCVRVP